MEKIDEQNLAKLEALNNLHVMKIVEEYINVCKPAKVTVITDSDEDITYIRNISVEKGEESKLSMEGHTVHFDGVKDQGRDKKNTKVLLPEGQKLCKSVNTGEREEGVKEVLGLMEGIMEGKEMFVRFFCLGPLNSKFSIKALQLTDSSYVSHSEDILYRAGYEEFKRLDGSDDFFHFVHSAGELDERNNTKNVDQRRIYMDLEGKRVFTVNNQYAGNSVGLKKLALRLAIRKSQSEDWLCEHMFIMGAHPPGKDRVTYFTGAFPSACGKTSTAMIPGQTIIGDDIAYLRAWDDGTAHAVNVEQGIFGIIENVNPVDDALIYKALTTPRELIFSNVLVNNNFPYWLGMGKDLPKEGSNYAGEWKEGDDASPAHKNARYTVRLKELENVDENLDNSDGVSVSGCIYGGRDSDTSPPVLQSFDWKHGVFIGAALESETTAATLGQAGVRTFDPMANMDFLTVPLGIYIKNHLKFGERLEKPPKVFATNYFIQEEGKFLNEKVDKKVWLMWMEGRIHNEYEAIETPVGMIPKYNDIKDLFKQIFDREYTTEDYEKQFSIRFDKLIERLDRIEEIYKEEPDIPEEFSNQLNDQRDRLKAAKEKFGKAVVPPSEFEG